MPKGKDREKPEPQSERTIEYVIATLVAVLVVLIIFLALDYRNLRRSTIVGEHQSFLAALLAHHHGPATAADIATIRPWMTFEYLNKFFALPSAYLQTQLSITDPQYPRLTIGAYMKHNNLASTTFIENLEAILRARSMNATSTDMPTSTPANTTEVPQGYL